MKLPFKKLFFALVALVLVGGGLLLYLLSRSETVEVDRVILVTIDTVRADHLGCYGYPRRTSPFIDELARRGARFERAFAPVGITAPSHASIFTALYPLQHRVLTNGHRLGNRQITMAEALKAIGFRSVAFVSVSKLFSGGNLHQGFSHFDEPPESDRSYRAASETIDAVIKWLDQERPVGKLFLWVHLFDPHFPYRPPRSHIERLGATSGEKTDITAFLLNEHHLEPAFYDKLHRFWTSTEVHDPELAGKGIKRYGFDVHDYWENIKTLTKGTKTGRDLMARVVDAYDGEISFVDSQLRRLHQQMHQRAHRARSLWIITGDHGEGLGNHQYLAHGKQIYNAQLHVPLIISLSGGMGGGRSLPARKISRVVELLNLFPTVLELTGGSLERLGKRVRRSGTGASIRGVSLVPLLLGRGDFVDGYALSQRKLPKPRKLRQGTLAQTLTAHGLLPRDLGDEFAVQDDKLKYLLRTNGPDQLFDLKKDPYERHNLIQTRTTEAERLKKIILKERQRMVHRHLAAPVGVDKETLRKIRSLGYIQ